MAKLTVSLAGVDYDRTRALFDGTVQIVGCETICCAMSPEEAFHRAFRYQEFDITELSLSNSMALVARDAHAYVVIPVFPSRLFRHSSIYIRGDRGIERPEDLRGKVIGVPEYTMTAALWIRGILQDDYGLGAADVRWRSGGLEQPGREARVSLTLPPEIELQLLPAGETLAQNLDDGRIDGLISALAPSCFGRNPLVRRLFPDYRAAEEAYLSVRGCSRSCMWSASAGRSSKSIPGSRSTLMSPIRRPRISATGISRRSGICSPPCRGRFRRARALMGEDFWSYGVDASRYAVQQGIIDRQLSAEDLFAPSTLSLSKI